MQGHVMPANSQDAVPSTAAIAGHPQHPMFVPFPLPFWSERSRAILGTGGQTIRSGRAFRSGSPTQRL